MCELFGISAGNEIDASPWLQMFFTHPTPKRIRTGGALLIFIKTLPAGQGTVFWKKSL